MDVDGVGEKSMQGTYRCGYVCFEKKYMGMCMCMCESMGEIERWRNIGYKALRVIQCCLALSDVFRLCVLQNISSGLK